MPADKKIFLKRSFRVKPLYSADNVHEARILTLKPARNPLEYAHNKVMKRFMDLMVTGSVMILFMWWALPLLALFIKLTSKGPVFFVQKRSGLYNKPFNCYKLRTMHQNEDANKIQATLNDPRITSMGKFLRKFSLDELPQFFNVLKGDMSIVGPRPHMLAHTEEYTEREPQFHFRNHIRPGITGLSQVEGYRGEIKDDTMLHNRIRLDLFYIKKWNLFIDTFILAKTIKLVLLGDKNAY